nr:hypothetical protein [Deltaproteobacteria bacterium]
RARGDDPGPTVSARRASHLRRAARARLWLTERFEPEHRPQDIPDDDPRLLRARASKSLVHPKLWTTCQVLVLPPAPPPPPGQPPGTPVSANPDDPRAKDPAWQQAAREALAPLQARIERNVPADDPEACTLISREVTLSGQPDDPQLRITFEGLGGFDLDACAEAGPDGQCIEPQFDPTWTATVRNAADPGSPPPFFTRFGLHLVHVHEILPQQLAGEPATEEAVRAAVHEAWRTEALSNELDRMGKTAGLRMAAPTEPAP